MLDSSFSSASRLGRLASSSSAGLRSSLRSHLGTLLVGLLAVCLIGQPLQADTLTWDINSGDGATITGGTGTWTNGAGNWNNGTTNVNWSNATPYSAIFGGTAATVTLGGAVTVENMIFNSGYSIAGGGNTLALSSSTLTANTNATIGSTLGGSTGLIKDGTGKLALTAANTFTGDVTVSAGTLEIGGTGTILQPSNASIVSVASGATILVSTTAYNSLGYAGSEQWVIAGTINSTRRIRADGAIRWHRAQRGHPHQQFQRRDFRFLSCEREQRHHHRQRPRAT